MPRMTRTLLFATVAMATFGLGAVAQTADAHHTAKNGDQAAATQPADQAPADQMAKMMQDMMASMPMMQMMKHMQGQHEMTGLDLTERVEGRIAFLKAEIGITDAQGDTWNAFADALRTYSAALKSARPAAMDPMAGDLVTRLDQSEKELSAKLDGVRGLKAALVPLLAALSDDQRSTAADLLPVHLGLGMMGQPMQGTATGMTGGAMTAPSP